MNISNIFELYQGVKPIRRVYLDGTMVWAEPYFLPAYLVHLNHHLDGDRYLTAASIALLNGDLDEKQIVSVHRSVLNDLAVKLVNDVFSEHFLVYSDEYLTTIATELIAHSASELARTLREAHGFVAASRIGNHSADHDVLDEYYHQSAVMHGGLLDATAKHGVLDDTTCVEFDQADHYAIDLTAACIVDEHEQSVEYDASANAAKGDAESVSANKSAIVEFGSDSVLNTLFWLLPVQTDTDLYVPMIYDDGVVVGAIQNGVNLDMRTYTT